MPCATIYLATAAVQGKEAAMRRVIMIWAVMCLLSVSNAVSRTWFIKEDGSGDAPTIQAGMDSSIAGDTVLVAPGVYTEPVQSTTQGNSMIIVKPGIKLIAEGEGYAAVLDATRAGRVVYCGGAADSNTCVCGFKVTGGYAPGGFTFGGGILCHGSSPVIEDNWIIDNQGESGAGVGAAYNGAAPVIRRNVIEDNSTLGANGGGIICYYSGQAHIYENTVRNNFADHVGGGIFVYVNSSAVIRDNWIEGNSAVNHGGGVQANLSNIEATGNVIVGNTAYYGGGINITESASAIISDNTLHANEGAVGGGISLRPVGTKCPTVMLERNIIANSIGDGIYYECGSLTMQCNDCWGSTGSDYSGTSPGAGDFSEDPLFCDPDNSNFTLQTDSPCVDGYGCGQIGAYGVGCGPTQTETTTWGAIKAMYR